MPPASDQAPKSYISYTISYTISRYRIDPYDIVGDTYDIVYTTSDIVGQPTISYTTSWRTIGKNSPPTYDIVRKLGKHKIVYDIVGLTYDIVYDGTYDVVRTIGKNSISTYDVAYDVVRF